LIVAACAFTVAGFFLSLAAKPIFKLDEKLHATGSQCGYRFNTYVGLAIAGSLFGTQGVARTALLLGVMIPLANFGAVAVLASHSEKGFLTELAQHPLVVSSLAGFAWNAMGLPLPGFADQTLSLLGQTACRPDCPGGRGDAHRAGQGPVGPTSGGSR
jgi:predicted permease